jgi:hypothetical protein
MTANDATPPNQVAPGYAWQTLIEFSLPGEPGNERLAEERVAAAVQRLNCSPTLMRRLKLTVAKAAQDVIERGRLSGSTTVLHIRVLTPDPDGTTVAGSQPGDEGTGQPAQPTSQPTARSWGLFLVQKQEEDGRTVAGESRFLIELFLYEERKQVQR